MGNTGVDLLSKLKNITVNVRATAVLAGAITGAAQPPQQTSSDDAALSLLAQLLRPQKEPEPSLTEQLLSSAISSKLRQREPQSFLSSYAGLLSQASNPYQDVLLDSSLLGMG